MTESIWETLACGVVLLMALLCLVYLWYGCLSEQKGSPQSIIPQRLTEHREGCMSRGGNGRTLVAFFTWRTAASQAPVASPLLAEVLALVLPYLSGSGIFLRSVNKAAAALYRTAVADAYWTALRAAFASPSTFQFAWQCGIMDVHKYERNALPTTSPTRYESCAYLRSANSGMCQRSNCQRKVKIEEVLRLVAQHGTVACLAYVLEQRTVLFRGAWAFNLSGHSWVCSLLSQAAAGGF